MSDPREEVPKRYTIEDLDFLMTTIPMEPRSEMMRGLSAGKDPDGPWGDKAIKAPRVPGELIHLPWTEEEQPRVSAECRLAQGDDPRTLDILAQQSQYAEVLMYVAQNPHTPGPALAHLATAHGEMTICNSAARNPTLPTWLHEVVYDGGLYGARSGLMQNPGVDPDLVDRAAASADLEMRVIAALSERCRPATLARLARDPEVRVRAATAGNPSTPQHILDGLATELDPTVQTMLVQNRRIVGEDFTAAAQRAITHHWTWAFYHAVHSDRLTDEAARLFRAAGAAGELAGNERTPADILVDYYRRGDAHLRMKVVRNKSFPQELRRDAAVNDRSSYVREAAADYLPREDNPRVHATVADLTPGTTVLVAKCMASRPDAGPSLAESFLLDIHSVDKVETRKPVLYPDLGDYQVVTLTGTRRRLNGAPAARYPHPVTYSILLSGLRLPDRETIRRNT